MLDISGSYFQFGIVNSLKCGEGLASEFCAMLPDVTSYACGRNKQRPERPEKSDD